MGYKVNRPGRARLSAVLPALPPMARTATGMGQMAVSAEPERMTGFSEGRRHGKKKELLEGGGVGGSSSASH